MLHRRVTPCGQVDAPKCRRPYHRLHLLHQIRQLLVGSVRAETGGAGRAALAIDDNFPVQFTTQCDVNGCVPRWNNKTDHVGNPGAPLVFEYRWNNDRWETSGEYPYFCDRNNPKSVVKSTRSDYLIPNPDGSFFGERTLTIDGAGCPGEGPGTHWLPISLTPVDPPP
jgi:hypothetical protein